MLLLSCFVLASSTVVPSRPPWQTDNQAKVFSKNQDKAAKLSDAAKAALLQALDGPNFRNQIAPTGSVAKKPARDLLDMMYEEIANSFFYTTTDYATWNITRRLGYVPQLWEAIVEGIVAYDPNAHPAWDLVEVKGLGFPSMALPPARPALFDRETQSSFNIWKLKGGLAAGTISFSINQQGIDGAFLSPVPAGVFFPQCGYGLFDDEEEDDAMETMKILRGNNSNPQINCAVWDRQFGTPHHFYHLIMPHINFWGANLADYFLRWYSAGTPMPAAIANPVWEGELCSSFLLPERLLFLSVAYSFFGTPEGTTIQQWMRSMKRPMLWASPTDNSTFVDPYVDNIDGRYKPSDYDHGVFKGLWDTKVDWATFQMRMDSKLHIKPLGFYHTSACNITVCTRCRFIGVNGKDECMYWDHA